MSTKAVKTIRKIAGESPIAAALILGSGLGDIGEMLEDRIAIAFGELKGFPAGGVSGHGRDLLIGTLGGKRIAVLTGREHYYEHGNAAAMRPALETLAELGATTLLLTNSAGSLDEQVRPGDLLMLADHINYAGMNPLIGEPGDRRFVNMVDAYDPELRKLAMELAHRHDIPLKEGVYLWYSGPSFETPAEISMAIRLGANAVGMSTAPEVIVARMLGLRVWACSSITNMGAGLSPGEEISHEQTKSVAKTGAEKLKRLLPALVEAL
jgi:purine-nucleoside phosphorylase